MTAATLALTPAATTRSRLVTGPLLRLLVADTGGLTGFYLLLSVVPLFATSTGVGGVGAGLATGALMLSTVAAEIVTAALVARFGYRAVLVHRPAPARPARPRAAARPRADRPPRDLPPARPRSGHPLRGLRRAGAALVPADRRGEGLGMLGAIAGMPAIVAMPLGLWLAGSAGFTAVFVAGGVVALLGLVAVPGCPAGRPRARRRDEALSLTAGLRNPGLVRPAIVFAATATAAGIVATFLPAAVGHGAGALAGVGLLTQSAAGTIARWWAGRSATATAPPGCWRPARSSPPPACSPCCCRQPGRGARRHGALRRRLRRRADREHGGHVRPGLGDRLRHGQRALEHRLRQPASARARSASASSPDGPAIRWGSPSPPPSC